MVEKLSLGVGNVGGSGAVSSSVNASAKPATTIGGKGFGELLKEKVTQSINETNADQKVSEKYLADMASGNIKDLHQAAIAIGKAETSMKALLEVRNKAINAYKEILRTQV